MVLRLEYYKKSQLEGDDMSKVEELLQELLDKGDQFALARIAGEYESAMQTAATAGLIVRPTTVAAITFYNSESPGGKDLVIDRIFTHNLVSTAVLAFFQLWYCMHKQMDEPTAEITALRGTGDGVVPASNVIVDAGATVGDDGWFPAGGEGSVSGAATTPQGMAEWEVKGRLKVPPGGGMSLQVVSSIVADTFTTGASWHRHQF